MKKNLPLIIVLALTASTLLPATAKAATRFLALGDSYAAGTGIKAEQAWPHALARDIRFAGLKVDDPLVVARNGWTAAELAAGIDAAGVKGTFDFVVVMIGVNNQYRGQPVEAFRQELEGVLSRALIFSGDRPSRVVIVSLPDYGVTPVGKQGDEAKIAKEIDAYNAALLAEARRRGMKWAEITALTRSVSGNPDYIAGDGLHFAPAVQGVWARFIFSQVRVAFPPPPPSKKPVKRR